MGDERRVTLRDVAKRANKDPEFFAAVVQQATDPNQALSKYEMQLSREDADTLRKGITAIAKVDLEFQAFGGWGRWPGFEF